MYPLRTRQTEATHLRLVCFSGVSSAALVHLGVIGGNVFLDTLPWINH